MQLMRESAVAAFLSESLDLIGPLFVLAVIALSLAVILPVVNRWARRLEATSARRLLDLSRGDAIKRLKIDLGALSNRLRATEEELEVKTTAVREAECSMSDKESELANLRSALDESSAVVDLQKAELVAAGMQVEALKGQLIQMGEKVKAAEGRRNDAELAFSDKEMQMARLTSAFGERSMLADSQKLEIMVLGTQLRALQERLIKCGEEAEVLEGLRHAAECALFERDSKLVMTMSALEECSALANSQRDEIAALTMHSQRLQGRVTKSDEAFCAADSRRVAAIGSLSEKESELARVTNALNEGSVLLDSQKAEIAALVTQVQTLNEQLVQASEEAAAVEAHRAGALRALSEKESKLAELTTTLSARSALVESRNAEVQKLSELLAQTHAQARTVEDQRDIALRSLSEKESEAARLATALNECSAPADAQKVENAALRAQIRALNDRLIHAGKEAAAGQLHEAERCELMTVTNELMEERGKFDNFYHHATGIVEQLTAQRAADEILHRRAREDLENRLIEQSRLVNESESEIRRLCDEMESSRKAENDLRVALIEIEGRGNAAAEDLIADKAR